MWITLVVSLTKPTISHIPWSLITTSKQRWPDKEQKTYSWKMRRGRRERTDRQTERESEGQTGGGMEMMTWTEGREREGKRRKNHLMRVY